MSVDSLQASCEVIVLTALPVVFRAVMAYISEPEEVVHENTGTIYVVGRFAGQAGALRVAVAEISQSGVSAAVEAERALDLWRPRVALLIGTAGGVKDVRPGDVVVCNKIYAYEAGKAGPRFTPHPQLWMASYALSQRASFEALSDDWLARLSVPPVTSPQVVIGPIAAGAQVLASRNSDLYRLLQSSYNDTLAVEMEGHGFLHALHAYPSIQGLVVRGITNLLDDKGTSDTASQRTSAARHAAAFAFHVLATFTPPG